MPEELLPQVARWQHERAPELTIALVSEGAAESPSAVRDVAMQVEREVAEAYAVTATPAALLIDREGIVVRPLAVGAEAIEALVQELASRPDEAVHAAMSALLSGLLQAARCSSPLARPPRRSRNLNACTRSRSTIRSCWD